MKLIKEHKDVEIRRTMYRDWYNGADVYRLIAPEKQKSDGTNRSYDKNGVTGYQVYSREVKATHTPENWVFLVQEEVKPRGGIVYHVTGSKDIKSLQALKKYAEVTAGKWKWYLISTDGIIDPEKANKAKDWEATEHKRIMFMVDQVLTVARPMFEDSWAKTEAHYKQVYDKGYKDWKVASQESTEYHKIHYMYHQSQEAEIKRNDPLYKFWNKYFDVENYCKGLTKTEVPWMVSRSREYTSLFLSCQMYGFDQYMKRMKDDYFEMLTAKLIEVMAKYLKDYDFISNIKLHNSAKGYVISALILKEPNTIHRLETQCVHAGGHNIQCFHYRYLVHIKF